MAEAPTQLQRDTRTRILDVAERLAQRRGYNGFSYADVATEVGVTKASLHYHFAGKAELGAALIDRYTARFFDALTRIDRQSGDTQRKLEAFAAIYAGVLREQRMCLCGMLAADYETLPASMQKAVVRFFDETEERLTAWIVEGEARGELRPAGSAREAARGLLSGLEGAMLVARPYGDTGRFEAVAAQLLQTLTGRAAPDRA